MMRSLSMLLLGAGTLLGAATLTAQPPSAGAQPDAQAGMQGGARGGHGRGGHGRGGHGRGARGPGRMALRGITLTDAQRGQLRTIAERYRPQHEALRQQARAQWGAGQGATRAARPDSATRAAFRTRMRDLRERQLADVRAVLTPAQRATFDRNVAEMRTRTAAHQRDSKGARRAARGTR